MSNSPAEYWTSYEPSEPLRTLPDLHRFVEDVSHLHGVMWRGVANGSWGMHSSLYRYCLDADKEPPSPQRYAQVEQWIADLARDAGLDRVPSRRTPLELLAWLQHTGSPTRLIDVSSSPLVAAWFACGSPPDSPSTEPDGRIFALSLSEGPAEDPGHNALPWADGTPGHEDWQTNSARLWIPPAVDARIAAQHGAFIVGPLPRKESGGAWYNSGESKNRYKIAEVRELTSVPIRAYASLVPGEKYKLNPVVSVRVDGQCKQALRDEIERTYNVSPFTLFPDPHGLAAYVRGSAPPS